MVLPSNYNLFMMAASAIKWMLKNDSFTINATCYISNLSKNLILALFDKSCLQVWVWV